MVLMELCSDGALDSYLQKNQGLSMDKLNEMVLQAAWGLEFIHRNNVSRERGGNLIILGHPS